MKEALNRNWTLTSEKRPPDEVVVETMDSSGRVQDLIVYRNLWWFPDKSMYIYYVPIFWKEKSNDPS